METRALLVVAGLPSLVAGCTTAKVSRAPLRAEARFTIAHLELSQVDVPPKL